MEIRERFFMDMFVIGWLGWLLGLVGWFCVLV